MGSPHTEPEHETHLSNPFNNRGPSRYLHQCLNQPEETYSPRDIAMESDFAFWTSQIKQLLRRVDSLETENDKLRAEVNTLNDRVSFVEGESLSLRKSVQEDPTETTLHAKIQEIRNKQEEIISQQVSLRQETETHISSWAQVVRENDKSSPITAVEEVVQAKLVEERSRRARELNLKVRGLPLPLSSADPMEVATGFLRDTLDISDIRLDRAWLGQDSTLFIRFHNTTDRLYALRAKRKLFDLPHRIFLDEDLTRAQVAELKQAREQVAAARQAGKWAVIRNLCAVIRDSFPPGWTPRLGSSK